MPSADQVPIKLPHLTMLRPKWVVLIAGSTGSALRAVRPPNLHITPVVRRDLVYRASATGSLYRSPLTIMAQTIRAILLASATANRRHRACGELWRNDHTRMKSPGYALPDLIQPRFRLIAGRGGVACGLRSVLCCQKFR